MKQLFRKGLPAIMSLIGIVMIGSAPAFAATAVSSYQANLAPVNNSGASAVATVTVNNDNTITVQVDAKGVSPNLPHAQHIHIGGQNTCPTSAAEVAADNNLITTASAQPFYGMVKVSLVTSGDDSANSAVAVNRFPTADASGNYNYTETLPLPSGVTASDIANGVIVIHGDSTLFGDPSKYDGSLKSSIDPSLPLEATIPVACGKLTSVPSGAPNTGSGSTAGIQHVTEIAAGAGLLAVSAIAFGLQRKFTK